MNEIKKQEVPEAAKNSDAGFKSIKAENGMTKDKADSFVKGILDQTSNKSNEVKGTGELIKNKEDGLRRESEVKADLEKQYPSNEIVSEVYLRDSNGKIVKDPITNEARRIDFVITDGKKVVDSIEVTSLSADKTDQTAKENRIRDIGGNYIKDYNENLILFPKNIETRIERRM